MLLGRAEALVDDVANRFRQVQLAALAAALLEAVVGGPADADAQAHRQPVIEFGLLRAHHGACDAGGFQDCP